VRGPARATRNGHKGVFVDARCPEGAAAGAEGDFSPFEVAEEIGPFLVGGDARP
jgi:hypothetical protein